MLKGLLIAVGAATVTLGAVGVYEHYKNKPPNSTGGQLVPGTMPSLTLSASALNNLPSIATYQTPAGGTITGASGGNQVEVSYAGSSMTVTGTGFGSGTVTVQWTNSTGKDQTTTIPVTVQN